MDFTDEIFLFCASVIVAILIVATALVVGITINTQQQIQFEQVCVNSHRSVVHVEVDGSLVTECK